MKSGSERRRSQRRHKVSLIQAQSFLIGNSVNLSLHGARVELHEPLLIEIPVQLDLAVGDKVLEIPARVIYVHRTAEGNYHVGLEFQEVTGSQRKALKDFLEDSSGPAG